MPLRETVKSELKAANQQQALGIAILLIVLVISPVIIFLVRWANILIIIIAILINICVLSVEILKFGGVYFISRNRREKKINLCLETRHSIEFKYYVLFHHIKFT